LEKINERCGLREILDREIPALRRDPVERWLGRTLHPLCLIAADDPEANGR
jgi:hypothetical protein